MTLRLGVVMDPITTITYKKDTTLALLLAAQKRNWSIEYFEQQDLFLRDGQAYGYARSLAVYDNSDKWFAFQDERELALADLDVILMRKDPPFNLEYIYSTYILERAENAGVLVVNRPQALRDANEKLFTAHFAECCPPTLIARTAERIKAFLAEHGDIVVKPPDGMGGMGVFRLRADDPNINVILETLIGQAHHAVVAQRFLPEISEGDKRILLIDGTAIPYALARLPAAGETRANLAAGGRGVGMEISARERWICEQVGPKLRAMGLVFVGLDVIGGHLTEINVTSPTCVRELDSAFDLDIGSVLMDAIEQRIS